LEERDEMTENFTLKAFMMDFTKKIIDDKSSRYFTTICFNYYTEILKNIYLTQLQTNLTGKQNMKTPDKINIAPAEMKNI
jgi:hypothetical protein